MTLILLAWLAGTVMALAAWRVHDVRAERSAWRRLASFQPASRRRFELSMTAALPEPARRFFRFAIEPGTPLVTVAEIRMKGELGLGNRQSPQYRPMTAEELLAVPHGFVWRVRAGSWLRVAGSDGAAEQLSWSRFWLLGFVPVGRAGGNPDHLRSSFGRLVAEAIFWTPAALLPSGHVAWHAAGRDSARVTVSRGGLQQTVELQLDDDGRPIKVSFQRWSNANPEKVFQLQPFGGYLSAFREFDGYRLPTRIEAGNFLGTDDYFPFFRAEVTAVRFPD